MSGRLNKGRSDKRPKAFYELGEVRKLVVTGAVLLRNNALEGAREAFGWDSTDILAALAALQPKHFHKSDVLRSDRSVVVDYYKAFRLRGENVYTHFYVNDKIGKLVVNSFKEV